MAEKEKKRETCRFKHDWPAKWGEPFTPGGYRETVAIQRRTCRRCNITQQRFV